MQRRSLVVRTVAFATALGIVRRGGASARPADPPDDLAASISMGGMVSPGAAPGLRLRLARVERRPGWSARFDGGAFVACVAAGDLAAALFEGSAAVWRPGEGGERAFVPLIPGDRAPLRAGECFAVDADGVPTSVALRNPGPGVAEVWQAALAVIPLVSSLARAKDSGTDRLDRPPAFGSHAGVR